MQKIFDQKVLCEDLMKIIESEENVLKRIWVSMLLKELGLEDVAEYRNCMRMSPERKYPH